MVVLLWIFNSEGDLGQNQHGVEKGVGERENITSTHG